MSARGRACEKCDFFEPMEHEKLKGRGICRVNSPTRQWLYRLILGTDPINIGWPVVNAGDWCGKFEALPKAGDSLTNQGKP
jgi:hypothetical protein